MCGDPWDEARPRAGEAGGKYGRGVVVRTYSPGQRITVSADITANHQGYFEFRLCPQARESEACLDRYVLSGGGGTRYLTSAH